MMSNEPGSKETPLLADQETTRQRAAAVIKRGGLVAFRTDTFYGIGANPFDGEAVRRVNELKGRDGKPILVVLSDYRRAGRLIDPCTATYERLSELFWPGPLTLVVGASAVLPAELTAGTGTIGVRLPADPNVRRFVEACGGVLTATSANRSGEPPARSASDVSRAFPTGLDLIVDDGATEALEPSTVVDVTGGEPRLIREGALPWRRLLDALAAG